MKGIAQWDYHPYHPAIHSGEKIYIARIAPNVDTITLEWFSEIELPEAVCYTIHYRKCGETDFHSQTTQKTTACLKDLEEQVEYEFYVSCKDEKSRIRMARTGFVPGTVVNYLHPQDEQYAFSGRYLCSPSLLKHPDGYLLVSMDVFAGERPQNLTLIFRSDDNGETWHSLSEIFPCFWGKLFYHRGEVYLFSLSTEYGDLLIGKSSDGGKTFGLPTVIVRGACSNAEAGWHKAPMVITEYAGRLWTAVDYGAWKIGGHANSLASVPVDADLLNSENWTITQPVPYNSAWNGTAEGKTGGCIEGNAVVAPDGSLYNFLRYNIGSAKPNYGLALLLKANPEKPEEALSFEKTVYFPGNHSKFDILYDEKTAYYFSIISRIRDAACINDRNLLSLVASKTLEDWRIVCDLLDYTAYSPKEVGFQYVSFLLDGEDILYISRSAFNQAHNFHDSNYATFHRIPNFRRFL